MEAGRLDKQLVFESPRPTDDSAGNYVDGFEPQFKQAANIKLLRGGETAMASRLAGVSSAIVTIRASKQARAIGPDWRAADPRAGVDQFGKPRVVYQVKEFPRESEDRGFLEFLVTNGVSA